MTGKTVRPIRNLCTLNGVRLHHTHDRMDSLELRPSDSRTCTKPVPMSGSTSFWKFTFTLFVRRLSLVLPVQQIAERALLVPLQGTVSAAQAQVVPKHPACVVLNGRPRRLPPCQPLVYKPAWRTFLLDPW